MVFGTAAAQIEFDRTAHLWWAWHPVRLQDGRIAWLGTVCRWWSDEAAGGWRYAALEEPARRAAESVQ